MNGGYKLGPIYAKKTMHFLVGSTVLVRVEGCPGVGLGLASAFSSVWLALESLAFAWFFLQVAWHVA
jgi:hypothetical protein